LKVTPANSSFMATIAGITGKQVPSSSADYKDAAYQYATSSHEDEAARMSPGLIIYPEGKADIALAIKHAKEKGVAIAVRSGGHQYSGASSTSAANIQLDLEKTFRADADRTVLQGPDGEALIRVSVSWPLGDFSAWLLENEIFVPHGQCTYVHLGGHCQSGGYGQLIRSFGLLGDHVRTFEMIDCNGEEKEVTKTSDPDLFFALSGGSPGNLGIVTHVVIEVHRDADYTGAQCLKILHLYDKETLKRLLDIVVQMSDDISFPRNFDLTINVVSSSAHMDDLFPEAGKDGSILEKLKFPKKGLPVWPNTILVYAQYVPFGKDDPSQDFIDKWFASIKDGYLFTLGVQKLPMSKITGKWLFTNVREFDHPYIKRCYNTNSRNLAKNGWTDWIVDRLDGMLEAKDSKCYISSQMQCVGGTNSMLYQNRENGTAFSWRDTSFGLTLDCFYDGDAAKATATKFQEGNDAAMVGASSKFGAQDKRLMWASYGDIDLNKVWQTYFDSEEKYERIGKARGLADPEGVFTPNAFCVKAIGGKAGAGKVDTNGVADGGAEAGGDDEEEGEEEAESGAEDGSVAADGDADAAEEEPEEEEEEAPQEEEGEEEGEEEAET
jgi:hypothetical protein